MCVWYVYMCVRGGGGDACVGRVAVSVFPMPFSCVKVYGEVMQVIIIMYISQQMSS